MSEIKIAIDVAAELVKVACGFLSVVNMCRMIKAAKAEHLTGVVEGGFLAVLMAMIWKL
ncbi:MAG: hypothetical protein IIV62_02445 [Anaerotignum sp.]|nr:hypothetical protein [Anaerotignum sp.]